MKKELIFIFGIILLSGFVIAAPTQNMTEYSDAKLCLNESRYLISDLNNNNFSINRVNDTYKEAEALFLTQQELVKKNKSADFDSTLARCEEIKTIYNLAINSKDQVIALKAFYQSSVTPEMNTTSIDLILANIDDEMKTERYEKVNALADSGYQEIINVKSQSTALNLFYSSTARGLKNFFQKNWITLSVILGVVIIMLLAYRIKIMKWNIERKINRLELRKQTIKSLIMQTQKEYFEKGNISESLYNIRTKKYAELMRDIERETPLLREELAKISKLIH
jgi:uncharacterized membrane protein